MGNVTIKDMASALELSPSTVSRALRNSHEINEKTRKLVEDYAKKVNYRRNTVALSLKEQRTKAIGVVIPEISNNFFSDVINGIEDEAFTRGYQVLIFQTHESLEREINTVQQLYERRVDGLLISLSGKTLDTDHIKKYSDDDLKVVYLDRVPHSNEVDKVVIDNFKGAYEATSQLIKNGCKKIAVTSSPVDISIANERLNGYKKALQDFGLSYDKNLIRFCGFEPEEAYQAVEELIMKIKPDALMAGADRLAVDSYTAYKRLLNEKKCSEIPFFGFTNLSVADLLCPPINAIVQPAYELGVNAAKLLLDRLEYDPKKVLPNSKPPAPFIKEILNPTVQIHQNLRSLS